ncbi:MAG TPA: hypothetical protein VFA39_04350 [Steroidobacteraceae bacterium]|nr:hypothetical protein [Steroidobacteraceae bacterium]
MRTISLSLPDELIEWCDSEASLERRTRSNLITVALEAYRARRETSVLLTPGRHVIDGKSIEVQGDGDRAHVWYPLPAGKHVIDDRIVMVHAFPGSYRAPESAAASKEAPTT